MKHFKIFKTLRGPLLNTTYIQVRSIALDSQEKRRSEDINIINSNTF